MPICSGCQDTKVENFSKRKSSKTGYQNFCRKCQKEYKDQHYQEHRADYIKKARLQKTELSKLVVSLKLGRPCMDCHLSYPPWVMDFDHRPGTKKVMDVSQIHMRGSARQVHEEIAKCDLVCSNCHRERTHSRLTSRSR